MKQICVDAVPEQLETVQAFIEAQLQAAGCPGKTVTLILIAAEEIYINIASYAYEDGGGEAVIRCEASRDTARAVLEFEDQGQPFNPLAAEQADITSPADRRKVGGLGILMVREMMDQVGYCRKQDRNILTVSKSWQSVS